MSAVFLFISHCIVLAAGYAYGKLVGFRDAQPERDSRGKFIKRG